MFFVLVDLVIEGLTPHNGMSDIAHQWANHCVTMVIYYIYVFRLEMLHFHSWYSCIPLLTFHHILGPRGNHFSQSHNHFLFLLCKVPTKNEFRQILAGLTNMFRFQKNSITTFVPQIHINLLIFMVWMFWKIYRRDIFGS